MASFDEATSKLIAEVLTGSRDDDSWMTQELFRDLEGRYWLKRDGGYNSEMNNSTDHSELTDEKAREWLTKVAKK
jgi:hypothetical protein